MATLTLASFTIQNFHRPGIFARLKIWFGQDFTTAEGQRVLGGATRSGSIYVDIACSLNADTHVLTIPAFTLPTTNDSSVRNVRATALLFDSGGAFVRNLFTGWIIPSQLALLTDFEGLEAYNSSNPRPPDPLYPDEDQIISLIDARTIDMGNLSGSLTANRTPRAATEDTLVDGLIQDDGTTLKIQSLNTVEMGDVDELQNGSYISINDTDSRVSFQAGGDGNSNYAGVSAVAANSKDEFYIQGSHGNGYNYGAFSEGVAKLGDGLDENNGTKVEIDDVNQWIKLHNLPTLDPGELNALWNDAGTLKISAG